MYVVLAARKSKYSWWIGLLSTLLYLYIFYTSQLYADVLLQIFYIIITIYGLYTWAINKGEVTRMKFKNHLIYIFESLLFSGCIYYLITHLNLWFPKVVGYPASFPITDSMVAGFSIAATRLIAIKKLECWLWWILIDLTAVGIYFQKELYITTILFLIYSLLALYAFFEWKKTLLLRE